MKVGMRNADSQSPIIAARTQRTLEYALSKLRESTAAPYIRHVYLYGSCARKEQSYESDVDLLVEFDETVEIEKCKEDIVELKGAISPDSLDIPEVDMHVVIGKQWKEDKSLYYENIRREGIEVWDVQ